MMNGIENHGWYMGISMGWWWLIGFIVFVLVSWFIFNSPKIKNRSYFPGNKTAVDLLTGMPKAKLIKRNLMNARRI